MKGIHWLALGAVAGLLFLGVAAGAEMTKAAANPAAPAAAPQPVAELGGAQPDRPIPEALGPPPGKDELLNAATQYINQDVYLKGGYFLIYDPETKQPLVLTLTGTRTEMLQDRPGRYIVHADCRTADGKACDVDFLVFQLGHIQNVSNLVVTRIDLHSLDGKVRYNWVKSGPYFAEEFVKK